MALPGRVLEGAVDPAAHPLEDPDEAGAGPVRARAADDGREPGTSTPAAIRNAAEDGSAGTVSSSPSASSSRRGERSPRRPGRTSTPAAASIRSVWSRLGSGSTIVVGPAASSPASSTHGLDLRARDRQLVRIPCRRPPVTVNGGSRPSRASIRRAHLAQRLGDPVDGPAADRLVAVERRTRGPSWAGEPAGQQPHQRAGVADVDRRVRDPPRRAGRCRGSRARRRASSTSAPSARGPRERRESCRPRRGSCARAPGTSAIAPRSAARCEIDLSAGGVSSPRSGPLGSKRTVVSWPCQRSPGSRGRTELLRLAPGVRADPQRDRRRC